MSYVLKSNHRNTGTFFPRPVKIITGVSLVLVILYVFFPRALPSLFTTLVRPFWGEPTIEEFKKTFAEAETNLAKNNALQKENEELKALLGRSSLTHPLLATILKKPPFSAYDTFILDVGHTEKVKVGDKVYALGYIPIGEIAEVVGATSKVRLYSSSGEKFTIYIGAANIEAAAVGRGGGYFESTLPRDTKIVVGDPVRVPSLDDSFAGTVEGIASDPSEPFSKVLFRQPVNIYELRFVLVNINDTH